MSTDLAAQTLAVICAKRERDYQLREFEIDCAAAVLDGVVERLKTAFVVTGGRFGTGAALKRCAEAIEGAKAVLETARTHVQHFEATGQMR